MLVLAFVCTVISLALLIAALVTAMLQLAWACVAVSVLGFIFLIIDIVTSERRHRRSPGDDEGDAPTPKKKKTTARRTRQARKKKKSRVPKETFVQQSDGLASSEMTTEFDISDVRNTPADRDADHQPYVTPAFADSQWGDEDAIIEDDGVELDAPGRYIDDFDGVDDFGYGSETFRR